MDASDPTRANIALWQHYLTRQWNPWLAPIDATAVSLAIGEGIARAYSALWGPLVGALFTENASGVTRFVEDTAVVAPEVEALPPTVTEHAAIATREATPEWLTSSAPQPAPAPTSERPRYATPVRRIAAFA